MPGADERIGRLEESLAFTERTVEQLSGEIAEMNWRLQAMGKRLAALEERLTKLAETPEEEASSGK